MDRIEIINWFIQKKGYKTYLEIGCQNNHCFDQIRCISKVGVDPEMGGTLRMTSDEFFNFLDSHAEPNPEINQDNLFDIIFIDGLHQSTQVYKDINNALRWLTPNGIIICHDMLPSSKEAQVLPRETKHWNGDCWMAWVWLRATNPNLQMYCLDRIDCGTSIIKKGKQTLINPGHNITYENMLLHKQEWMNTINEDLFKQLRETL